MGRKARLRATRRDRAQARARAGSAGSDETGWTIASLHESEVPIGPDVVTADLETVLAAVRNAPHLDDWPAVRRLVIPVLPRVRPQPPGSPSPLRRILPPGIAVGFAVDIGPAFMMVTAAQCKILGISEDEVATQSLANLVVRAERLDPGSVIRDHDGDVSVAALQTGQSIASALVLLPDHLGRLFGPDPAVLLAPMRDLLLALPSDVNSELAAWWFDAFASQDPNHLAPVAYRFDGRAVAPLALGAAVLSARRLDA